jgi:chromosome segregation ATPase
MEIDDLTIEKAIQIASDISIEIKRIDAIVASEKKKQVGLQEDKAKIKEQKRNRIASLQKSILGTTIKSTKDRYRKSKQSETESYNRKIASKDKEIHGVKNRIANLAKKKAELRFHLVRVNQRIKKLKAKK